MRRILGGLAEKNMLFYFSKMLQLDLFNQTESRALFLSLATTPIDV